MPQLFPKLVPMLEKAFEPYEEFTWEVGMTFLPDPASQAGDIAAFVGLFVEMPGAVVGTCLRATSLLNPNGQTQETLNEAVRTVAEQLQQGRSAQLTTMAQQQENALANGKPSPVSGLILPN